MAAGARVANVSEDLLAGANSTDHFAVLTRRLAAEHLRAGVDALVRCS
jgi:hypothetical protein